MVQAILAGRKTQTRREVKFKDHQPTVELNFLPSVYPHFQFQAGNRHWQAECPYGKKGDVLWVRETFGKGKASGRTYYKASEGSFHMLVDRWKPSIHMPKDAARIWLRINDVRVERLQDITGQDAISEGVIFPPHGSLSLLESWGAAKKLFQNLWQSINGSDSWKDNPWIWVIEFERIEKPEL